jgi:hypothetical protein
LYLNEQLMNCMLSHDYWDLVHSLANWTVNNTSRNRFVSILRCKDGDVPIQLQFLKHCVLFRVADDRQTKQSKIK